MPGRTGWRGLDDRGAVIVMVDEKLELIAANVPPRLQNDPELNERGKYQSGMYVRKMFVSVPERCWDTQSCRSRHPQSPTWLGILTAMLVELKHEKEAMNSIVTVIVHGTSDPNFLTTSTTARALPNVSYSAGLEGFRLLRSRLSSPATVHCTKGLLSRQMRFQSRLVFIWNGTYSDSPPQLGKNEIWPPFYWCAQFSMIPCINVYTAATNVFDQSSLYISIYMMYYYPYYCENRIASDPRTHGAQ